MRVKESKEDRFHRVAEARTDKILSMIRLLGNCSNSSVYAFIPEQVDQIFAAIETELYEAKIRFKYPCAGNRNRFSLSKESEFDIEIPHESSIRIELPDGTFLRAVAYQQDDYPSINIYWDSYREESPELICSAEYNPERSPCHELCIAAYRSDQEDTAYYRPYFSKGDE